MKLGVPDLEFRLRLLSLVREALRARAPELIVQAVRLLSEWHQVINQPIVSFLTTAQMGKSLLGKTDGKEICLLTVGSYVGDGNGYTPVKYLLIIAHEVYHYVARDNGSEQDALDYEVEFRQGLLGWKSRGPVDNLTGHQYGRLFVVGPDKPTQYGWRWFCRCQCGEFVSALGVVLKSGKKASCGCLARELTKTRATTHGMSNTGVFQSWRGMKKRCKFHPSYIRRGIKVCRRWAKFENFYQDKGDEWFPGAILHRMNNNGNYCPSNTIWKTKSEHTKIHARKKSA